MPGKTKRRKAAQSSAKVKASKEEREQQKRKMLAIETEEETEEAEPSNTEEEEEESNECLEELCMHDIVGPVKHFKERYWGKDIFIGEMWGEGFEKLKNGFGDGNLCDILQHCRKDDNTRYTPAEMDGMEEDFLNSKKTINMPLCFTEGADEIRNVFLKEFPNLGNDVEVGVYFSRTGGEIAHMHSDNNHNITIQVAGTKEWHCRPGSQHTERSKALSDAPKNLNEQRNSQLDRRSASAFPPQTYVVCPGSVIYLPPGYWHSVVSTGEEDSFSIDIRVGNITHAKWIAEAVYNKLYSEFHCSAGAVGLSLSKEDYQQTALSNGILEQSRYLRKNLMSLLVNCPPISSLPFERDQSNGFHRGSHVSWLLEKLPPKIPAVDIPFRVTSLFTPHPMVSFCVKLLPNYCVLYLFSESTLTTMEYIRYSMFCCAFLEEPLQLIASQPQFTFENTAAKCPSGEEYHNALQELLLVLVRAGVVLLK